MVRKLQQIDKKWLVLGFGTLILLNAYLIYVFFGDTFVELFQLLEHGDQQEMMLYLNSRSQWSGYLALFLISILQVVSIFIPGMIIQITGALMYGWWRAFVICWLGFVAGNAFVFVVARMFGKSVEIALAKETKTSWLMEKINQGNPILVVMVACMVPGIPNGIIPYIAARSNITLKDFALAVFGSSWIQILLNCVTGHFLIMGEWGWMILAIVVQVALIVVMIRNRDKLMNGKN